MKPLPLLLLLALALSPASAEPNLVPNGAFDAEEPLNGWALHTGQAALSAIESGEEGGGKALAIAPEGEKAVWVRSATIKVSPGSTYQLSFRIKGENGTPWAGVKVYESDGGWNPEGGHYLFGGNAPRQWEQKEATFITRPGTRWLYIGILLQPGSGGALVLDDITLHPSQ